MYRTYVTFGHAHYHEINQTIFDKDCVAVIYTNSPEEGRELAFQYFDTKFCFEYPEEFFDKKILKHFPRGLINVNSPVQEEKE